MTSRQMRTDIIEAGDVVELPNGLMAAAYPSPRLSEGTLEIGYQCFVLASPIEQEVRNFVWLPKSYVDQNGEVVGQFAGPLEGE